MGISWRVGERLQPVAMEIGHASGHSEGYASVVRDIPFNKPVLSQQNVRKIKPGVSIEDLAEDIARLGLLSSLNVRTDVDAQGKETGIYRILTGGRARS